MLGSMYMCLQYSDEDEIAKMLIDAGAKVNSKNHKDATPMIIAAVKGHTSVLRILANHPDIELSAQVSLEFPSHFLIATWNLRMFGTHSFLAFYPLLGG